MEKININMKKYTENRTENHNLYKKICEKRRNNTVIISK